MPTPTTYTYSITTDFTNASQISVTCFQRQLSLENTIPGRTVTFAYLEDDETFHITFDDALTAGEKTSLDTFVGNYVYYAATPNIYFGDNSLSNISAQGTDNIAVGNNSLLNLFDGDYNIGIGTDVLKTTSGASHNVALGHMTMEDLTTGEDNTALGSGALHDLTTGGNNIGIGYHTGHFTTTGIDNIYIGREAGEDNITGNTNIFIGCCANTNGGTGLSNTICIGKMAKVNESNTAVIGGSNITDVYAGGVTGSTGALGTANLHARTLYAENNTVVFSDERDKTDISPLGLSLDFIKELKPISYRLNPRSRYAGTFYNSANDGSKKDKNLSFGLLAQDVKKVLENHGVGGDKEETTNLFREEKEGEQLLVSYVELIPVLINAIQELSERVDNCPYC